MKNKNIFTKIFIKNIPLFFIEILSAYIATKVLVLGNTKISQAIDALFNNTISEYINKQFWIYVAVLVAAGFIFTYIQTYATKVLAVNMQTDFRREAGSCRSFSLNISIRICRRECLIILLMMWLKFRNIILSFFLI